MFLRVCHLLPPQNVVVLDSGAPVVARLMRDLYGVFAVRLLQEPLRAPPPSGQATALQKKTAVAMSRQYRAVLSSNVAHIDDVVDRCVESTILLDVVSNASAYHGCERCGVVADGHRVR